MRKTYKAPLTRFVGLDPDELLQFQGTSTNLDDTGSGGGTEEGGIGEADSRRSGIWNWGNNDD